jgi:hypothetical protein
MYAVLSGCLPFFGSTPLEVFKKIKIGTVNYEIAEF